MLFLVRSEYIERLIIAQMTELKFQQQVRQRLSF